MRRRRRAGIEAPGDSTRYMLLALRYVWGYENPRGLSTRTLDSHASRLRKRLNGAPDRHFVQNVWGVGYRLTDELASEEQG